jgi:DNA-binding transcriptional ArsR family regulator
VAQKKRADGADRERGKFRLRVRIVAACHLREVTPREIAYREKLSRATVQYHFDKLVDEGWIHVKRTESVQGGIRQWYVADKFNLVGHKEFEEMDEAERYETSEGVLMHYLDICREALEVGTLDARPDSHLSHTPMNLDQQGWEDLRDELDRLLERSLEIKAEAMMRLRRSGAQGSPTVVHLAGFEIPATVTAGAKS